MSAAAARAVDASMGLRPSAHAVRRAEPEWCPWENLRQIADQRRWYLLRVTPGCEKRAVTALREAGLDALIPVDALWRWRSAIDRARGGEKSLSHIPALPGYAVVGFDGPWDAWVRALTARHVTGFVGVGGAPRRLSTDDMMRIAALGRAAPRAWRRMLRGAEFGVGDRVTMLVGPLTGWIGRVVSVDEGHGRALIDMDGGAPGAVWAALDNIGCI